MAKEDSNVLTHADLLTDIDCNFNNKSKAFRKGCHDMEMNDVSHQEFNGSMFVKEENVCLEVNDIKFPSNGFKPVNFYSSRKQDLTPSVKMLGRNAKELISEENVIADKQSCARGKRKCEKQDNLSGIKKRQRTSNLERQCSPGGNPKHGTIEICCNIMKKESLFNDITSEKIEDKGMCEMINSNSDERPAENGSLVSGTFQSGLQVKATDCSSWNGSQKSAFGEVSDMLTLNSDTLLSNLGKEESVSGPSPVSPSLILVKHGNEYVFTKNNYSSDSDNYTSNSHKGNNENCTITSSHAEGNNSSGLLSTNFNGKSSIPNSTDGSQSSLLYSLSSSNTDESDSTMKFSERDTDSSSTQSSPERQVPITKYFSRITGLRSRTRSAANEIPYSRVPSTQRSPDLKSSVTSPKSKKSGKKQEQMYLDLGQKDFGHVTCPTCGMVYTKAQPDDEAAHIRHHKSFVSGLRFAGWKNECVVKEYHDGRVLMVGPDAHPLHRRKIAEVRKVVDSELGFVADGPCGKFEAKTFLFISARKVVGCAVAVQIDQGYPVLPSPGKSSTPEKQIAAWCCSTTPQLAQCGISRIWVHSQHRRKKVATRLLDCVSLNFIYGCVIPRELVAFSDPTPDGKRLAKSYTGTAQFLVFR